MSKIVSNRIPNWLIALLLVFASSIMGLAISLLTGSFIPLWLLFGFSVIYSVEKWFYYTTRRHKWVGKIYKLILNLSMLSLLGLIIWSGVRLFSQQLVHNFIAGSLIFLAEFVLFIWVWRVISRNSWRFPSMKLTVFSLLCIFVVFSFAGVQPMAGYRDGATNLIVEWQEQNEIRKAEQEKRDELVQVIPPITVPVEPPAVSPPELVSELRNPSWEELKAFLWEDKTDQLEYIFPTFVCDNFARTLQANAKAAGWRCAHVVVKLSGYPDWFDYGIPSNTEHSLNAFETTDRGLVYVDCTGLPFEDYRPGSCDKIVDVAVGKRFIPISLFPEYGWGSVWLDGGEITKVEIVRW